MLLALLCDLAVLVVLSAVVRLARSAALGFVSRSKPPAWPIMAVRAAFLRADFPLAAEAVLPRVGASMIAPETFSHIENIKKRAGYLWRFL